MILILSILFTVILVLSIKIVSFGHDMALSNLRKMAEGRNNKLISGWFLCEWCMPSIWSILGYAFAALYLGFPWNIANWYLIFYPIIVGAASVISGITWTFILYLIELLNSIKMKNEIFKLTNYEQQKN